ncbi:MAG: HlyD family efflux transporter periplasmic adaptor subunit [Henriciella sp.]|nr:HlyD family efflux transporter periplasmic adaptor subunit [Henriciella sp.]
MSSDLFREEALEFQSASNSRFGKPTGVLPPSWVLITLFLAAFMVALITFLLSVDFARKETVRGKLRVDGAEAKLYALEPGLITKVMVEDGQAVNAGDPIAEITSERYMSDGGALSEATLKQLERERTTLQRRKAAIETASDLSIRAAEQRYNDAKRQERELKDQLTVVNRRLEIARNRAKDAEQFLEEQLIAEPQLNERLEAAASLEQMVLQTNGQVNEAVAAQSRAALEKRQLQANRDRDLADIDQRLEQMNAQIERADADTVHIVRAPIEGKVTGLQARAGEQAINGIPLGIVLPQNSELIAEVYLPSRAIGFVEPRQIVKLQYDAFPYQKFGIALGEIQGVASTAQLPQELNVASQTGEPLYRVSITLAKQTVEAFSKEMPLQAGMEFTADIVLENRRLSEWLLEPLAAK